MLGTNCDLFPYLHDMRYDMRPYAIPTIRLRMVSSSFLDGVWVVPSPSAEASIERALMTKTLGPLHDKMYPMVRRGLQDHVMVNVSGRLWSYLGSMFTSGPDVHDMVRDTVNAALREVVSARHNSAP